MQLRDRCGRLEVLVRVESLVCALQMAVRLRLPPTPSLDDAVTFDYGQPVFCRIGTSTPLLVRTLRRT